MAYLLRKVIICAVSVWASMDGAAQTSRTVPQCEVLLLPMGRKINLLDHPGGKATSSILNDTLAENYFTLRLSEMQGAWSKVTAYSSADSGKTGWIPTENLGIYSRSYGGKPLVLYKSDNKASGTVNVIKGYRPGPWKVLECRGTWLEISVSQKGKKYTGWLPPEMQCANQYTTCN